MAELKTSRPFQERFLNGFDRSQLRQEVQMAKPRRFKGLRKKYATWALGASLALGGLGVPLKMIQNTQGTAGSGQGPTAPISKEISGDLAAAKNIADQVAGGITAVTDGVQAAASDIQSAASAPLKAVADAAPKTLALVSEQMKEQFFKTQVPFGSIIYNEAKKNNVRPELVAAMIQQESRFKPTARSHRGAMGLMQLVPKTAKWMGATNPMNPAQNIAAGAKYLKYLHGRFDGNEQHVIAAYNAGEGNVKRFGGVPPFKETKNYVQKVRGYEQDFNDRVQSHVADASVAEMTR
jgi:soluble lytic murein transglycosylase-like protein